MTNQIGSKYGNSRRATIIKYNNDGTVTIGLDEIGLQQPAQRFDVPMPLAWAGPNGEFLGGFPTRGSSIVVSQSQGGQWFIESYIPSRSVFTDQDLMGVIRPGRVVMRVKGGNFAYVDPTTGFTAGDFNQSLQADPDRGIFLHNFSADMSFTEGTRHIDGVVKRDLVENSNRGISSSTLDSPLYDDSLTTIAMDPSSAPALRTVGPVIRNPPFVENRELNYEFAQTYKVEDDQIETSRTADPGAEPFAIDNGRKDSRADILSLNLSYPNHLIETVKGTVVDLYGNVLDLNRAILPIGRIDELSLRNNTDKSDAYNKIRAQLRKSIAYHFEINTRKPGTVDKSTGDESTSTVPDVNDKINYSRSRSRLFLDIDKEGQFKLNIPQSSETGNIPFLTRYENFSNLISSDGINLPNSLVRNSERQDIFLDSFAGKTNVKITGTDSTLDGYAAPVDRITGEPIQLGTAYHDITQAASSFLSGAPMPNIYEDNTLLHIDPIPSGKLVEDNIIVDGVGANAGGRSGLANFEGMISLNLGASTADRQSLWFDYAGGVVGSVGRDKNNISYAVNMSGDMFIQIGGSEVGNTLDSRFADQNDGNRIGTIDIRIMNGPKPMTIFRLDNLGIRVCTEGVFQVAANQGILLSTNGNLHINGERVAFFTNTKGLKRLVERSGINI